MSCGTEIIILIETSMWIVYRVYIYIYIFVVNFDALAQASDFRIERRQLVFLCWMQDSNPEGLWNPIFSRLNARWQTDCAIEDQAKNLNSTARPYDQQAFSPPDPTAIWHSHLALAIYIFVVVNFDALGQASDLRIERRQLVFLCWMQDSNPEGLWNPIFSRLNACWQTDCAIEDQAKNLNSTARPYDQQAFSPPDPTAIWHSHLALALAIYIYISNERVTSWLHIWHSIQTTPIFVMGESCNLNGITIFPFSRRVGHKEPLFRAKENVIQWIERITAEIFW